MQPLSFELRWLIYATLLLLVMWVPYILAEIGQNGLVKALSYGDKREQPAWAERWKKAHYNLVENFAPFAVVVIAGEFVGLHTPTTRALVVIFFLARLVHPFAQIGRVWGTRTAIFAVGWAVTIIYLFLVLTAAA